ncbi:aminotransferase class I/II-fold pyridoxal phosphate-dependent enzyme [Kamptonema cortianum]|nr:aminotransferase class I/II-fold pyridoxal phosphate-dependent enzyme [Geitlerinema splendidum]MDK3156194.1 aminotransferase class I/II-fold pyridoxal phosphate-dependent enzyme [Kamptonema cortianum]
MAREDSYRDRSVLIHGKFRSEKWDFADHIIPPITTAVSFRLRSAERGAQGFQQFANPEIDRSTAKPIYIYDRLDEPCSGLLEETLAFAEKGECAVCFATGMAAVSAAIDIHVKAGEHVVFHPAVYGCTYGHITNWLQRFGINNTAVNFNDPKALEAAILPETRVLYFETPCNPTMELIDIEAIASLVANINLQRKPEEKIVTVLDNTFASPYAQRPITMGIDFVVHSLTKHIGGFGATMGGVVVGPRTSETDLLLYRKDFGGSLSPDAAWHILTYGVPTLSLRLEKQSASAMRVAEFLDLHPKVSSVMYPGLDNFPQKELAIKQMRDIDGDFAPGAMIYFKLKGVPEQAYDKAVKVINSIAEQSLSITLAVSLGQIRTLIEHPASMTHSGIPPEEQIKAGIDPGGIRLSLGLEDVRDVLRDLEAALDKL